MTKIYAVGYELYEEGQEVNPRGVDLIEAKDASTATNFAMKQFTADYGEEGFGLLDVVDVTDTSHHDHISKAV